MTRIKRFKDFNPSGFDGPGNFLSFGGPDYGEWWIGPSVTRDSEALQRANFKSFKKLLEDTGPEDEDWAIVRTGHWACGWVETFVVRPDTKAHEELVEVAERLERYPIIDDEELSREEQEEIDSDWENFREREVGKALEGALEIDDVEEIIPEGDDLRGMFLSALNEVGGYETVDEIYRYKEAIALLVETVRPTVKG